MIARLFARLRCLLRRHDYSPVAEWRHTSYDPRRWWRGRRWQARFRCQCCARRTRWMYPRAAQRLISRVLCTR